MAAVPLKNSITDQAERMAAYYPVLPWRQLALSPEEIENCRAFYVAAWGYLWFNRN